MIYDQGFNTGPIDEYNWQFENNTDTTISDTNFIWQFNSCGPLPINIELELISSTIDDNGLNCQWDTIVPVMVYCNPDAEIFTINSGECFDEPIHFIDTSSQGTGSIDTWLWDIDGGSYSNNTNADSIDVFYNFDTCEVKKAYLTITDEYDCTDTDSIEINIYCQPIAQI